jgi:hypothetical protein
LFSKKQEKYCGSILFPKNHYFCKKIYSNMTTETIKFPLSNIQLRLLQLFSQNVSEEDLKAIQRMLVRYFAEKASDAADKDWDEKNYDAETLLNEHMRTPYKQPNAQA